MQERTRRGLRKGGRVPRSAVVGALIVFPGLSLLAAGGAAAASRPPPQRPVTFHNGDTELAGVVLLPAGDGPFPGVVIIHGSGDSDRHHLWTRTFADALVDGGLAVLLPDKRGSGRSGGDWRTVGFEILADDALAAHARLRREPEVDPERVGVMGLSQGGRVAPLAAARSPGIAFVVDVSGSVVGFVEQARHQFVNNLEASGLSPAQIERALELHDAVERHVLEGAWEEYAALREEMLDGDLARVAAGFPSSPDAWEWGWWRKVAGYDPLPHWEAAVGAGVPALVIYGEEDEHENVPVERSVARIRGALGGSGLLTVRVFEGASHGLWEAPGHRLRPDVVELLVGWIRMPGSRGIVAASGFRPLQ